MIPSSAMTSPTIDVQLHISYWKRCYKSLLPNHYSSMDSSRVMLGFFILAGLDLLNAGVDTFPPEEVKRLREWILKCQHPFGGFCGSPNHRYPDEYYDGSRIGDSNPDPANLPATFFALLNLSFVDGLGSIRRLECLKWLRTLQRPDGSFGEMVGKDGQIEGGRDMRPCYFAASVRWMLRGQEKFGPGDDHEDIDVDKLVEHIRNGETYDGGFGESSEHESHGGYTYCATAALAALDRLPLSISNRSSLHVEKRTNTQLTGLTNIRGTVHWLLSRQLAYNDNDDEDEDENEGQDTSTKQRKISADISELPSLASLSLNETHYVGCNGRLNKEADTCYCFWVGGTLEIIGQGALINVQSTRRFLLEQTQHRIGGFGKEPGYPPDVYHAYLGLALLAMMREPGLKELDPVLCVSFDAMNKIDKHNEEILERLKTNVEKLGLSKTSTDDTGSAGVSV